MQNMSSSVKCLQLALTPSVAPHDGAGGNSIVAGYGVEFHVIPTDNYARTLDGRRRPHPYTLCAGGLFLGLDGRYEKNHNEE